uniref:CRiSP-Cwar1 n=1 Tax=Caribicus warreni TaxID=865857 RepID=E2E4F6_CARWR|nr:CRiSP-Cwar1 [Caribicus warreni]
MILLSMYLCLAAMLHKSGVQASSDISGLMTSNPDQQKVIVDEHNDCRRTVQPTASNMLRMEWDPKAQQTASNVAKKCVLDHSPVSERTIDGVVCGENLFFSSNPVDWKSVVESWDKEKSNFIYGEGPKDPEKMIGHHTQVVWYRSYKVGCDLAYCPNQPVYKYLNVCHYCPAGNVQGREYVPYKRGKPCGDCPKACDNGLCTNPCKANNDLSNCDSLKKQVGCDHPIMKGCKASCQCTTEII